MITFRILISECHKAEVSLLSNAVNIVQPVSSEILNEIPRNFKGCWRLIAIG